jgi:hypothetical protein
MRKRSRMAAPDACATAARAWAGALARAFAPLRVLDLERIRAGRRTRPLRDRFACSTAESHRYSARVSRQG